MNTQNLINLIRIDNIDTLAVEQLHNLIGQAYRALSELEEFPIEQLKVLAVIRRLELRLAELTSNPKPLPAPIPRFTP